MLGFGQGTLCCGFGRLDLINIVEQMEVVALDGVSEIDTTKNLVRNCHELSPSCSFIRKLMIFGGT